MFSCGLLPVITRPTRLHHTSATLIDHIFESNKTKRHIAGIIVCSISDHFPTFYIEECKTEKVNPKPFKTRIINSQTMARSWSESRSWREARSWRGAWSWREDPSPGGGGKSAEGRRGQGTYSFVFKSNLVPL